MVWPFGRDSREEIASQQTDLDLRVPLFAHFSVHCKDGWLEKIANHCKE
jgi:hypothetical protein